MVEEKINEALECVDTIIGCSAVICEENAKIKEEYISSIQMIVDLVNKDTDRCDILTYLDEILEESSNYKYVCEEPLIASSDEIRDNEAEIEGSAEVLFKLLQEDKNKLVWNEIHNN